MIVTKGDVTSGTMSLMRINGLTVNPSPSDNAEALQLLDDYMAELSVNFPEIPYLQPSIYGTSNPVDNSGLTPQMAGPVKKLLVQQFCSYFGKDVDQAVYKTSEEGMRALEHILVSVPSAQNPPTLPIGSGNEWDYRSDKFYPEPTTDRNPAYKFTGEVFDQHINWQDWLGDNTLLNVTYKTAHSMNLSNETFDDTTSTVRVSFDQVGFYELCATAESSTGEKLTRINAYDVRECTRSRSIRL